MELRSALARRRMVRSFSPAPLPAAEIDDLLHWARRGPSAGNTQATGFVVLDHPAATAAYWDLTLPAERRATFRWHGLLLAPVLVLVTTRPDRYVTRYAEADKAATGRGESTDRWPVPYWFVDAGAVVQNLLLLTVERGLGACLFGPFDHEPALALAFGLAEGERIVATVALGHPEVDEPGRSAHRARPPISDLVRRPPIPPAPA